jgi:hypothetical protein
MGTAAIVGRTRAASCVFETPMAGRQMVPGGATIAPPGQQAGPPHVKNRGNAKGTAQIKRAAPLQRRCHRQAVISDASSFSFINSCASAALAQARSKART